jgi:hypothetical protein
LIILFDQEGEGNYEPRNKMQSQDYDCSAMKKFLENKIFFPQKNLLEKNLQKSP